MLTINQCIFLLSFVSTCNLFPALITKAKADASLSAQALAEFHLFSELPEELQTSVALLVIDTVEQLSTKKWIAQSRTTNRQFNAIFSTVIEQAPVIFNHLQPKIDDALLTANFDTRVTMFPTLNDTSLRKIIAKNIITTNVFYTQQIAQGELLPSFCTADAQQNPLFFYPNFGCHLISCSTIDENAQEQETSDANKQKNLKLLLAHTTSHDPYSQEVEHFIQDAFTSLKSSVFINVFFDYARKYYDNNINDYINWYNKILNTNSLTANKKHHPLKQLNRPNIIDLRESLQPQIIQELENNPEIATSLVEIARSNTDKTAVVDSFVDIFHKNFGHLITPHINNNQLDLFIRFFCDGIYQGILQQNDR